MGDPSGLPYFNDYSHVFILLIKFWFCPKITGSSTLKQQQVSCRGGGSDCPKAGWGTCSSRKSGSALEPPAEPGNDPIRPQDLQSEGAGHRVSRHFLSFLLSNHRNTEHNIYLKLMKQNLLGEMQREWFLLRAAEKCHRWTRDASWHFLKAGK